MVNFWQKTGPGDMIDIDTSSETDRCRLVFREKFPWRMFILSKQPSTIPALKQWNAGHSSYTFGPGTRILLRNTELIATGTVFAEDLQLLTGLAIPVVHEANSQSGDI